MGLATVQQILAQLYTNTDFRKDFLANPQAIGQSFGLTEEEIQQLAQLSSRQVNLFASSLKYKRLGEVRKFLPLTHKILDKDFSRFFWQYIETYHPQGLKKHWHDAINFCTFLETKELEKPWILDVVRYEKAWLKTLDPDRRLIWCRFDYAIQPLIESLIKSSITPILLTKPSFGIWWRLSVKQKWIFHELNFNYSLNDNTYLKIHNLTYAFKKYFSTKLRFIKKSRIRSF